MGTGIVQDKAQEPSSLLASEDTVYAGGLARFPSLVGFRVRSEEEGTPCQEKPSRHRYLTTRVNP